MSAEQVAAVAADLEVCALGWQAGWLAGHGRCAAAHRALPTARGGCSLHLLQSLLLLLLLPLQEKAAVKDAKKDKKAERVRGQGVQQPACARVTWSPAPHSLCLCRSSLLRSPRKIRNPTTPPPPAHAPRRRSSAA